MDRPQGRMAMAAGYVIVEVDVQDAEEYARYGGLARPTIAKHGGKAVVLGGKSESLEGGWAPRRLVVLEFPSYEAARNWYYSPEYQDIVKLRFASARSRAVLVEGT